MSASLGSFICAIALACCFTTTPIQAADPGKVLRVASTNIETLDPQRYTDDPSYQIQFAIFEGLYEWDYLASPSRISPNTSSGVPDVTEDGRTWTIHIKPGIYFTDDPAFRGKPRELVADDYVYSIKRMLDPALRGGNPIAADLLVGARTVVESALATGGKFDYDRRIEGLRALDRYTLQMQFSAPNYPVAYDLLTNGAVAREVVEAANGDVRTRAVGTGPYRLKEWKEGSRIVLEANPDYRVVRFPQSSDPAQAPVVAAMRDRPLPRIGRVEVSFIEDGRTRALEFEGKRLDYVVLSGEPAKYMLAPERAASHAAAGIRDYGVPSPYTFGLIVNMRDPTVGGMGTDRIALRRAIGLAIDADTIADVIFAGQAISTGQLFPPGVAGHDPALRRRAPSDPDGARKLLDRFGYRADAKGRRLTPSGKPVTITFSIPSNASSSREVAALVTRDLEAIGIAVDVRMQLFQDLMKELMAGRFQVTYGAQGGDPTGWIALSMLYSRASASLNAPHFFSPDYDRAAEQFMATGVDEEKLKAARTMTKIADAYAPFIPLIVNVDHWFVQPWVSGFSPPAIQTHWKYMDLDPQMRGAMARK